MNKRAKRIDRAQNVILTLLSASLLLLLLQTPLLGERGSELSSVIGDWLSGEESTVSGETAALSALSIPVTVVQTREFLRSGSDALTTSDAAFVTPGAFLGDAIGSASDMRTATEEEFLAALGGSGLYFSFPFPLPLEVLAARLGVSVPTAQAVNVHRCLLSAESASVVLYLRSDTGAVLRFATALESSLLNEQSETADELGGSVEFAFALGEDYAALSPYTLVRGGTISRAPLTAANALTGYPTEELLRRAEFNPHTNSYRESSGTTVVVEGQRKLYLRPDGALYYSGGALEGSALFTVPAAEPDAPTRAEQCVAARSLISALMQGRCGDAVLFVSGMETSVEGTTVTFDYMVDGTSVRLSDGSHAAEVRIEGTSITAFSLLARRYTLTESATQLLPMSLARVIAARYPACELSVAYIDSYGDTVEADWIAD